MSQLFIGIMSGTSADGIDAVLVDLEKENLKIIHHYYLRYDATTQNELILLMQPGVNELERMGILDRKIGCLFANAVKTLLKAAKVDASSIGAIGSHGQTIRHSPNNEYPFTMQIGDPNIIAAETGIKTIADFRRKDMALGGQGAPLVPRFHQAIFQTDFPRMIVNIGGIANLTVLPPKNETTHIIGFDTGPGNALLNSWIHFHHHDAFDQNGNWAKTGKVNEKLLGVFLQDPYFYLPAPKSTGRDYFNHDWIQQKLKELNQELPPNIVQATLTELTALTINEAIKKSGFQQGEIIVVGGGAFNQYLMERLNVSKPDGFSLITSDKLGINPNLIEALAFAWLAKQTLEKKAGNLPSVTGAFQEAILGGIYH